MDSLSVLDALIGLPLMVPVAVHDLSERELRLFTTAPPGCVEFAGGFVTRTLRVPVTVAAAVVRGKVWRSAILNAASFTPLTQRIVVVPQPVESSLLWEAEVAGIGVWVEHSEGPFEVQLRPEPFVPRYFKAAGWRFAERAYQSMNDDQRCADRPAWA